ncbi:protein tyrosine phosphatase, putative [Trypanosoma brucei brucei TREU927]|uniref:very-long-chain (3R)-3-hydroxyacyl-CoA dehydratase n=2 Tax=Trypanozoon TaxID=39700 RepID=Q389R7_TRYB2|nr:protein tyrosine phosphatase, putative [Trypanosoma brucei brucei TREU927]EAN78453.1 protein tyrosine phosphatase, putative [Trypanosoma brucei brucei TREU927]
MVLFFFFCLSSGRMVVKLKLSLYSCSTTFLTLVHPLLMLSKVYLLAYNGVLLAGWSTILMKIVQHLSTGGRFADVYSLIAPLLVVSQSAAVLEVLHALFGLVRSPVGTTLLQVLSRLLVLYGALEIGPTAARMSPFATQMIVAWSLAEVIRYTFYASNLAGVKLKPVTWLRYSAFTVLYPMGITGEIACFISALPYIREKKPWTVELPNRLNFSFSWYYTVLLLLAVVYPAGSYVMYTYMLQQRRKALKATDDASQTDVSNKKKAS